MVHAKKEVLMLMSGCFVLATQVPHWHRSRSYKLSFLNNGNFILPCVSALCWNRCTSFKAASQNEIVWKYLFSDWKDFLFIWHLPLEVTKMHHTETFPLQSIHPCETFQPWWNSIILWGKKTPISKTFCQVLTRSRLSSEKSQSKWINSSCLLLFLFLIKLFCHKEIYTMASSFLTQVC